MTIEFILSIWMVFFSRLCTSQLVPVTLTQMYRKDLLLSPASGPHRALDPHEPANSHDVSVCRGHMRSITCPNLELLHIFNAFYGKLSGHDCEVPITRFRNQIPTCFSKDAPNIIRQSCQGQQSCDLYAEDSLYSNPCPSVRKYLYVSFTCQGRSRLPEILKMFQQKQAAQRRFQIHQQEIIKNAQKTKVAVLYQQQQQQKRLQIQHNLQQRQALFQRQQQQQQLQQIEVRQRIQQQQQQQQLQLQLQARQQLQQRMLLQQGQQLQQRLQMQQRQQILQNQQHGNLTTQFMWPQSMSMDASPLIRAHVPPRPTAYSYYPYQNMMLQGRGYLPQFLAPPRPQQYIARPALPPQYFLQRQPPSPQYMTQSQQNYISRTSVPYAAPAQAGSRTSLPYPVPIQAASRTGVPYAASAQAAARTSLPYAAPAQASGHYAVPAQAASRTSLPYAAPAQAESRTSLPYPAPIQAASRTGVPYAAPAQAAARTSGHYAVPAQAASRTSLPYAAPAQAASRTSVHYAAPAQAASRTSVSYIPPAQAASRTNVRYAAPAPARNAPQQQPSQTLPMKYSVVAPKRKLQAPPVLNVEPAAVRKNVPPAGWQGKPDIKYYQNEVSHALNSLYHLYHHVSKKCDKCDGNCNSYLCYGCGGCPPEPATPQRHRSYAYTTPATDADKSIYGVKDAFRKQQSYFPTADMARTRSFFSMPTYRSNATQALNDNGKQYWMSNQHNQRMNNMLMAHYGKGYHLPFSPSLFKKQAQAYLLKHRPQAEHERATWSYQGKEWPHERDIPIQRNMWLAVRDEVGGRMGMDAESVVRTADGLTFQYHDAFANNAMALSGLVLYPFPKRKKSTRSFSTFPKKRFETHNSGGGISRKKYPSRIRQILGMKRSSTTKRPLNKKKKGRYRRSVETTEEEWSPVEEEWSPEVMEVLYEIT